MQSRDNLNTACIVSQASSDEFELWMKSAVPEAQVPMIWNATTGEGAQKVGLFEFMNICV